MSRHTFLSASFLTVMTFSLIAAGTRFLPTQAAQPKPENNTGEEIISVLTEQAAAWNHGDLDKFLTSYLQSPKISYVTGEGEVWGYQALHDRYKKKYGEHHDTMGNLTFSDLKVQNLGQDNALCIGHWHLNREGKERTGGIFSLIFVKDKNQWKIIHDHTSVSPAK